MLLTCEHGGNGIPSDFASLFAGRPAARALRSHRGLDFGAASVARALARSLGAPVRIATVSRLLIDLNRSLGHRGLFSEFSRGLDAASRAQLVDRVYLPHRLAIERDAAALIDACGRCIHIAVHSFTPVLAGQRRNADVGLLYDPGRRTERAFVDCWRRELHDVSPTLRVRRNYPYRGVTDGLTTALRRHFDTARYVGVELELNQATLERTAARATLTRILAATLAAALAASASDG